MNRKSNITKLIALTIATCLLSSCSIQGKEKVDTVKKNATELNTKNNTKAAFVVENNMIKYDSEDNYSEWKSQNPVYIQLNGTDAVIKGEGAKIKGSDITISKEGVYVLSGNFKGQITVDTEDKKTVRLVLNEATISCEDSSPIYIKKAKKAIISLQSGTENSVTDGKKYVFAMSDEKEPDAAIFGKSDIVINGTGKLAVHANYNNAIASKDDLKIMSGDITVNSVDDGLVGKDRVIVKDGKVQIVAGGDGIKTTNEEDKKGFIAIQGGSLNINSTKDGIAAKTSMLVTGGTFNIKTGGGSSNGVNKSKDMHMKDPWRGQDKNDEIESTTDKDTESISAKGLKASSNISITAGTFTIDSSDDAINSANTANIGAEKITINSGDDGIHADSVVVINKGNIKIGKSYEGIEATEIKITDGNIDITASDDGINVRGGNDGSSINGRPGQNKFDSSGTGKLEISGGYVTMNAEGDGLDSNGSITMTGGTVVVSGPTRFDNGAIDNDREFLISGGLLVAAGSAGMVQGPSENSTQNSIVMMYSSIQKAGAIINLKDSSGKIIATFAPQKEYQSVVIASREIKKGKEYTIYSGETKVVSFTTSKSVTWMSETGETESRGFEPGGEPGGRRGPGDMGGRPDDMGGQGRPEGPDGQYDPYDGQTHN